MTADLVGEAITAEQCTASMREVKVAAVDLHRFDEPFGCRGGSAMSGTNQVRAALVEHLKELQLPAMRACFEETAPSR